MGEIINTNTAIETQSGGDTGALLDVTQSLLADARIALNSSGVLSVPIAELSTLGAGVSSLIPALNTVTQTTNIAADGLYTIANAGVGDVLKAAKNGNYWASLKTAEGTSKMVQLQKAGPITATTQTAAAFNPATMMMAVALFSIEQELGEIEDMQRQIISFLEIEKESEIEADVESLMSIIRKYKDNWDNERFVSGNHNQVLTYQNRARKNMLGYPEEDRRVDWEEAAYRHTGWREAGIHLCGEGIQILPLVPLYILTVFSHGGHAQRQFQRILYFRDSG